MDRLIGATFELHADQLPAGNTYSIENVGSVTARVFFAQACQTIVETKDVQTAK